MWTLDPLGNWDQWKFDADFSGSFSAAETEDRTHNGVNELLDRNQGTGGTDETLTYDLAGNLRTRVANSVTTTYTHDAWNRLVKVVVGSATVLEQQHNGLSWRTWKRSDTNANGTLDEERTFTYDPSWRLVEERVDADYPTRPGLDRRVQHVWGKRYIDDAVLHRRDGNNDGDYLDANEGTWYHLTDAMYSTVALFSGASVVERVTYTPYGEARHHFGNDVTGDGGTDASDQAIVLGAWGAIIGNAGYLAEADLNRDGSIGSADLSIVLSYVTALAPGLISSTSSTGPDNPIGWDGYVFNPETRTYTVRNRTYLPVLGRWGQRDPAGYSDGMNLYEGYKSSPLSLRDPFGLQVSDDDLRYRYPGDEELPPPAPTPGELKSKRLNKCRSDHERCVNRCRDLTGGEELGPRIPADEAQRRCIKGCDENYLWCIAREVGPYKPLPQNSPECNNYDPDDSYSGANARCFCKCAGDSEWAQHVRACLRRLYEQGVDPATAHSACYDLASQKGFDMPVGTLAECYVKCSWIGWLLRCAAHSSCPCD